MSKDAGLRTQLLQLKRILEEIVLAQQISDLAGKIKGLAPSQEKKTVPDQPLERAIEELKNIATTRGVGEKTEFLLHRLTDDGEYTKSIGVDRSYTTKDKTSWIPLFNVADVRQDQSAPGGGPNPLVSCWVPVGKITNIPVGAPNTGTWGILGKNPLASKYEVMVGPGKYELYQELKE